MLKSEIKKHATYYGIFLGLVVFTFGVLITFTLLSRNSWKSGLASEMQNVLDTYSSGTYTVSKYIDVKSTLMTNTAVYSLIKKDSGNSEKYYGILIRIPTIIGPVPAVFIYNEKTESSFAGFAVDNGKAKELVDIKLASSNLSYWESLIPKIIEKAQTK